ncbi:MAG: radical SAM protein [Candidatus Peregrinibacteria bacterium]|nr:radical SAM protein [Candidatus Peregrinibacteria bacterium]
MGHKISDKERVFTSTGEKLLHHTEAMKKFQETGIATPIVAHIMPTSLCNLSCGFCSVKDRKTHETLDLESDIIPFVEQLKDRGLKAVILSGGGEPTVYPKFNELINYLDSSKLDIGLITNGTTLYRQPKDTLEKLTWMRVSINALENGGKVKLPHLKNPTVGFSYIVTDVTTPEMLQQIKDLAVGNNIEYVRLLPDCAQPLDKLVEDHKKVGNMSRELGEPFFHQYKVPTTPDNCFLGYFHPVLYCDGKVYPCDSLVLNDHNNQQFHEDFSICEGKDVGEMYDSRINGSLVDTHKMCPNCVFERQNTLLDKIYSDKTIISKPTGSTKHKNFI